MSRQKNYVCNSEGHTLARARSHALISLSTPQSLSRGHAQAPTVPAHATQQTHALTLHGTSGRGSGESNPPTFGIFTFGNVLGVHRVVFANDLVLRQHERSTLRWR